LMLNRANKVKTSSLVKVKKVAWNGLKDGNFILIYRAVFIVKEEVRDFTGASYAQ